MTETVSHELYATTLRRIAARDGLNSDFLDAAPGALPRMVNGDCIHHREAPQSLADRRADVAVVFHHLALRYTCIFPTLFEMVALTADNDPAQVISTLHVGVVGDGGAWSERLREFMLGDEVAAVYRHHGLASILQ